MTEDALVGLRVEWALLRVDTSADTATQEQEMAAEQARRHLCRAYALGVLGIVDSPGGKPRWLRHNA